MGLAYLCIVASTSQLISFKDLSTEKSYLIYIPKMISSPFLPEMIVPAETITQSPHPQEETGSRREEESQVEVKVKAFKT